jgi:hypothetical protein
MKYFFRKAIILSGVAISFFACHSDNEKSKSSFNKDSSLNAVANPVAIIEDFDVFFKKFNSDSLFQKSRIKFPFKIIIKDEDGDNSRILSKSEWHFIHLVNDKKEKSIIRKVPIQRNKILITYAIEDTGIFIKHFFENINGKWRHTYCEDESD